MSAGGVVVSTRAAPQPGRAYIMVLVNSGPSGQLPGATVAGTRFESGTPDSRSGATPRKRLDESRETSMLGARCA